MDPAVEDDDSVMAAMVMAGGMSGLDEANFTSAGDDVGNNGIFDESKVNFTALYTAGNLTLEIFPYCGADGELDVMVRLDNGCSSGLKKKLSSSPKPLTFGIYRYRGSLKGMSVVP